MQTSLEYKENLIRSSDGLVAECVDEAAARRLAVCANALRGANLDELEVAVSIGVDDVSSGNMFSSRLSLQRQRDALLHALQWATHCLQWHVAQHPAGMDAKVLADAKAAIEAVTGPAQGESVVG